MAGIRKSIPIPPHLQRTMLEAARDFRKISTPSEATLWQALRDRHLDGIKFRRQQPVGPFVVDFYAPSVQLVVEVDGIIHQQKVEADQNRQMLLESLGLQVLRFKAEEVEGNLEEVLGIIRKAIRDRPSSPAPSPGDGRRGERRDGGLAQ